MNKKIKLADLKDGDIMMKFNDSSFLNTLISFSQWIFTSANADLVTHAGIYVLGNIIEVNGDGLNSDDLQDKDHKDMEYFVFRANDGEVAYNIGGLAYQTYNRSGKELLDGKKLTYSKSGAFASLFRKGGATEKELIDSIEHEIGLLYLREGASQFCSEFVTICIQYAMKNVGVNSIDPKSWRLQYALKRVGVNLNDKLGKLAHPARTMTPANLARALIDCGDHFHFAGVLPKDAARI